jgi:DNA-binding GntR family transcriptional regulator
MLSSEGLVKLLPNRGAIVTTITRADAEDMFQVMAALEALAGELACERATEGDIAEIRALHNQMRGYYSGGELAEYFALNQRIHQKIVDSACNTELADIYRRISWRIRRARYMANFSKERWDHAMEEHEQILDALVQRDREGLKALLAEHLKNKFEVIQDWLACAESAQSTATA